MCEQEKEVDQLFQDFDRPGVPGASVMVIRQGKVLFAKGYGLANLETKVPCSTQTNFRLASVTKQFTAMAILIQAERGKLGLEDCIGKFFPPIPAYARDITVRQLLSHTSGLIDYEDLIPAAQTRQVKDQDVLELLCEQKRTYFPPGTQFRYSNTGYAFLALIVELTSAKRFAEFLNSEIFRPLGMEGTIAFEEGVSSIRNRALGYDGTNTDWKLSDQSVTSAVLGDGGVYSSVADLFKWDQALYTERLISRVLLKEAFTAASPVSDFPGSGYGFGWYVGKRGGSDYLWHYGSTCGFATRIARIPEEELSVIILANRKEAKLSPILETVIGSYLR